MSQRNFVLRAAVGGIMAGHGLQKLKGSFDGPGLEGTEAITKSLGLYPVKEQAMAVALSETLGGGLTAAGLLSPLGPAMIIGVMTVAVKKVHLEKGFWSSKGGYEFNLLLIAASLALAAQGPGAFSIDGLLRHRRSGLVWGAAAAAVGFGAAAATLKIAEAMAPAAEAGGRDNADQGSDIGDHATHDHATHDHGTHDHSSEEEASQGEGNYA